MDSFELFIKHREEFNKPAYNGMYDLTQTSGIVIDNTNSKYYSAGLATLLDENGNVVNNPTNEELVNGTVDQFVRRHFRSITVEGGSSEQHFIWNDYAIQKFFEVNGRYPIDAGEIGMNTGTSAEYFLNRLLQLNDKQVYVNMTSFDLGNHPYIGMAADYLHRKFPYRHTCILGTSMESVITYSLNNPNKKFDIIFIDGDHTFEGAYNDIINCARISTADTIVIMDNNAPHRGVGNGVHLAVSKCISDGLIIHLEHREFRFKNEDFHDGSSLFVYNFGEASLKFKRSFPGYGIYDYKRLERKVEDYILSNLINTITTLGQIEQLKPFVNETGNKFIIDKLDKKRREIEFPQKNYSRNNRY